MKTNTRPMTIRDMTAAINEGRYDNKMAYPNNPLEPKRHPLWAKPAGEITDAERKELQSIIDAYPAACEEYKRQLEAYSAERNRLDAMFWEDAARLHGITDNPRLIKLQHKAYERGHHRGYSTIWEEYCDLVDLIV